MVIKTAEDNSLGGFMNQMGRMMDQLQKGFMSFRPAETWTPSVNVYENEVGYSVCVDLAGVDKDKIDLQIADGMLRLHGVRSVPVHPERTDAPHCRWRVHLMEIDHGAFCRTVELPRNVHAERITATYRNGMLWIDIPKAD